MTNQPGNPSGFGTYIAQYAESIAANFRQQVIAQPEDQLKAPVGELLKALGRIAGNAVDYRTEVQADDVEGRPDIGVTLNGQLIGLIELKAPGTGAQPETFSGHNAEQWKRFRGFPNLIYTDGAEWSLYQDGNGEIRSRVRISNDIRAGGANAVFQSESNAFETLLRSFLGHSPIVPSSAEGLAQHLAPLTQLLRDEVRKSLGRPDSSLRDLRDEWAGLLFPEGDDAQFADAYAQTVTYALLLARFEGAERLQPAFAAEVLRPGHGLLAEALRLLEADSVRDELRMSIELLERAIGAVDTLRLNRQGDPWIYFYEQFLGAYDPELRRNRGVFYTPVEVVGIQTRLAAELLRTRFGRSLAFADDGVNVLDPAAGTGAYLLSVLDHAAEAVREQYGQGAITGRLSSLAERLFGFEILAGAYSVAHLRLTQRLQEAGVTGRPPKVYLTDTLESPYRPPEFHASIMQQQLTNERTQAQQVKRNTRVLVCIGNPPYDRELRDPAEDDGSRRKGGWVRYGDTGPDAGVPILEDFISPVREAGGGVHLHNLYNDYVYFWRWALWKVFESIGGRDGGIVTFITASSYLRGPAFAGMRRKMREAFDELWIIDLEGDSLGARKTENVFTIQTPVAIAVGVRDGNANPDQPATAWKVRLTGTAQEKLARLNQVETFSNLPWQECSTEWDAPFYTKGSGAYLEWPQVIDVFPWQHSGVKVGRTWPVSPEKESLERRWSTLVSRESAREDLFVNRPTGNKVTDSPLSLPPVERRMVAIAQLCPTANAEPVVRYSYRTFDRQWIFADPRLLDRPGPPLWRAHGSKQVYMTSLLTSVLGSGPAATVAGGIPDLHYFCGRGAKDIIPLWRDADATQPNVTGGLLTLLSETYGAELSPERLFAYAYAILAQPTYVERFWDELELPPPRLPLTKKPELFQRAASLGERLISLHTYGERYTGSVPHGEARCTKGVSPDRYPDRHFYYPGTRTLYVGDGEFAPVPQAVWDYSVSGMQIVNSWLNRRKRNRSGRKSSPLDDIGPERWEFTEELLQLLWVLEETVRLQPEGAALLDEVCAGPLFTADELPAPKDAERRPPQVHATAQTSFED